MVSSNKILTVSYGTFSCTLEGFDDSFDTMKAIAEYFRDLAQDDRYFGAEPPTPDAEMLARIAEREIERRVEARFEKGNLVLRPTDETETPQGDVAPEPSSGAALMGAATGLAVADALAGQDDTDSEIDTQAVAAFDPDPTEIVQPDTDLTLDLDVQDEDLSEPPLSEPSLEDATEEEVDESLWQVEAEAETEVAEVQAEADAQDKDDASSEEEFSIDALIAAQQDEDEDESPAVTAEAPPVEMEADHAEIVADKPETTDTVAEKLQRIRAVVASKSQEEPEYIEDEHAMSGPDGDGIDENDVLDMDSHIPDFDESTEDGDRNIFADTIAALVNDEIAEEDAPVTAQPEPETADATGSDEAEAELRELRAKIARLEALTAAAQTPGPADAEEDTTGEPDASDLEDSAPEDDTATPLPVLELTEDEAVTDTPQPIIARVSKAKRADVEAALAAGTIEAYDDDDAAQAEVADASPAADAHPVPGADDSTLTPEQEAELARELADLQAEIDEDEDWNFNVSEDVVADDADRSPLPEPEEDADANIRKAVKMTNPARALLTDNAIQEDDASVERLIDQTETEMDKPEGNRRRSAIAHLRAAVAATKADRLLGLGKKTVDEEEPYREDLADAVRPRRPKVTEARSERPAPVRPAPLKLVAEQRVDLDDTEMEAKPVRPRRVMRAESLEATDESAGNGTGFAEFAESQGAHTLQELLEAAAAYMSFVEGRDQFSRPQLMTKLHQAEGETSSREDRLRSFGQLLREGKIQKKGGGRFAASDSIGFKPDSRAAG